MIITLDGPAASGKGSIARRLSERLRLPHLDTGLLYRAVGLKTLRSTDVGNEANAAAIAQALTLKDLSNFEALRAPEASEAASQVAEIPEVRRALFKLQRDFARQRGGAILDGRDVGTRIAPEADLKLWVTAQPEIRAKRRLEELQHAGKHVDLAWVLTQIQARDARDAPNMLRADNAHLLDTSFLSIKEAVSIVVSLVANVNPTFTKNLEPSSSA